MTSLNPHPELVDGVDVDAVAAAVRSCPGVVDLDAGAAASVASYLPGRQLAGVAVADRQVTVQVRVAWGSLIPELARLIRAAVTPLVAGRSVHVVVSDIAVPPVADPPRAG